MKIARGYILLCLSNLILPALGPLLPSLNQRLHAAVAQGNVELIQSLIALTADPNALYLQRTALQTAMVYKKPAVIGCLLNHNAYLFDDIIVQLLKSGNEHYAIEDLIASLKILLAAGGMSQPISEFPRGYLTPVMIAHADSDAIHNRVVKMIQGYGKKKIS